MSFYDYTHLIQGNTCLDVLVAADRLSGHILVSLCIVDGCFSLENLHLDVKLMYIAPLQFPCLRTFPLASFLCF